MAKGAVAAVTLGTGGIWAKSGGREDMGEGAGLQGFLAEGAMWFDQVWPDERLAMCEAGEEGRRWDCVFVTKGLRALLTRGSWFSMWMRRRVMAGQSGGQEAAPTSCSVTWLRGIPLGNTTRWGKLWVWRPDPSVAAFVVEALWPWRIPPPHCSPSPS